MTSFTGSLQAVVGDLNYNELVTLPFSRIRVLRDLRSRTTMLFGTVDPGPYDLDRKLIRTIRHWPMYAFDQAVDIDAPCTITTSTGHLPRAGLATFGANGRPGLRMRPGAGPGSLRRAPFPLVVA